MIATGAQRPLALLVLGGGDFQSLIRRLLEGRGPHSLKTVTGHGEALRLLQDRPACDILLVEQDFAGGRGLELARAATDLGPPCPVVLCTAGVDHVAESEARRAGLALCLSPKDAGPQAFGLLLELACGRHQSQLALRERETRHLESLERSNRELQDFASIVSHDLQEPLYKVTAFGELLEDRCSAKLDDKGKLCVAKMREAAGRMSELISDLLAYSRVSSRAAPFALVDPNVELAGVLGDLEVRLRELGATVESTTLPAFEADGLQLRQLFQNFIGNALKFVAAGVQPRIRIYHDLNEVDGTVDIHFSDNGIGIDESCHEKIFQVFRRLHKASEYPGAGMGLAICRKIAARHGGAIRLSSKPGIGSTFTVTLPLRQAGRG